MKKILLLTMGLIALQLNAQNALNFDGANDYVQTSFSGISGTNNRTFEAWIFVDVSAPASNLCIFDYGLNAVGSRNTFAVSGTRKLSFTSGGTNANISSINTNVITAGQWTHVAFVLNSGTGYLYVNGIQVGTGSLSTVNTPSGNQKLIIGQRVSGGTILFNGSIDEVRIWDVARTPTEIANSMNIEFCSLPQNLIAYYNFNQGIAGGTNSNMPLLDAVDNKNGVLNNFSNSGAASNWVTGSTITPGLSQSNSSATSCDSFVSPVGSVWHTSGIYTDVMSNANANNCDSLITINLTINNSAHTNLSDSVCGAYTSPSGKYIYTTSGIYFDTLTTPKGCDWVFELDLTITFIDTTISESSGHTLTSNESNGDTYQWLDCANNYAIIGGATGQSFSPTQDGEYAVNVTIGDCIDTSDCYTVIGVGVNSFREEVGIMVFPNPATDQVLISFDSNEDEAQIEIIDVTGVVVYSSVIQGHDSHSVRTSDFTPGLYLINIYSGTSTYHEKLLVE